MGKERKKFKKEGHEIDLPLFRCPYTCLDGSPSICSVRPQAIGFRDPPCKIRHAQADVASHEWILLWTIVNSQWKHHTSSITVGKGTDGRWGPMGFDPSKWKERGRDDACVWLS